MTDRPILFSAPMVRALLEGRKTQTRRVLKPQPFIDQMGNFCAPGRKGKIWNWGQHLDGCPCVRNFMNEHVPCRIGDHLWVRETWAANQGADAGYAYRADYGGAIGVSIIDVATGEAGVLVDKWRPSIHMPRWASRLTLIVTDVRVQRLQDISEQDAIAEGIELSNPEVDNNLWKDYLWGADCYIARLSFSSLWCSVYDLNAWDADPWVAAYTFTVHYQNIDALEAA